MRSFSSYRFLLLAFVLVSMKQDVDGITSFLRQKLPTIPTIKLPLLPPVKLELLPAREEAQEAALVTEVPAFSEEDFTGDNLNNVIPEPPSPTPTVPVLPVEYSPNPTSSQAPSTVTEESENPDESETDLGNFIIQKLTSIEQKLDQLQQELRNTQTSLANQNANIEKIQPQTEENLSQFARVLSESINTRLGNLNQENVTGLLTQNNTDGASTRSTNLPRYPFGLPSIPSLNLTNITPSNTLPSRPSGGWFLNPFPATESPSNRTDFLPPLDPPSVVAPVVVSPTVDPSETNSTTSSFDIDNYVPDIGLISDDPNLIRFLLFTDSQNANESEILEYQNIKSIQSSNYDAKKPVKFLVHGFQNNYKSRFPQNVKNAYLSKNLDYNVIIVDWGALAIPNAPYIAPVFYPFAVKNVWRTGERLGEFISWLKNENLIELDLVHILGFSLGSHVSGKAGSIVQEAFNHSIARVTALDPAGPEFYTGILARKLNAKDGSFVDAIHTNAGQLGIWKDIGQVDYYVNGGSGPQPGCLGYDSVTSVIRSITSTIAGTCSHNIATQFYAKTIITGFSSRTEESKLCSCSSVAKYKLGLCDCETKVGFGEYSSHLTNGTHYIDFKL